MSRKHAYLIMAHNKFEQLEYLLSKLDYIKNDIYLFIDKKSVFSDCDKKKLFNSVKYSNLIFTNRIDVYWADFTQIQAELILFKEAYNNYNYSYFHLISGVDLPLRNQEYIYNFFDKNNGKIFINNISNDIYRNLGIRDRLKYKHLFSKFSERTFKNVFLIKFLRFYRKLEIVLQDIFKMDNIKKYNLYEGFSSNWCSLDNETVGVLLKEENFINKVFKNTIFTDELLLPVIISKNNLEYKLYSNVAWNGTVDSFQGNLRFVNWWDGSPYTWTDSKNDIISLEKAIDTGYLFSRKFDIEKYPKLKEFIDFKTK